MVRMPEPSLSPEPPYSLTSLLSTALLFLRWTCFPCHSVRQLIQFLLCIRFTSALASSLPSGLCLIELGLSVVSGTQGVLTALTECMLLYRARRRKHLTSDPLKDATVTSQAYCSQGSVTTFLHQAHAAPHPDYLYPRLSRAPDKPRSTPAAACFGGGSSRGQKAQGAGVRRWAMRSRKRLGKRRTAWYVAPPPSLSSPHSPRTSRPACGNHAAGSRP